MTPEEKKAALRVELLVDPLVLAPTPDDLAAIKPYYKTIIETAISDWNTAHPGGPVAAYGGFTDQAIEIHLATLENAVRPIQATSSQIRQPLLRGGWGKISLNADRVPDAGTPEEADNILCRNIMALLTDPQVVWLPEQYADLEASTQSLVTGGFITAEERDAVLATMMVPEVTMAYNKSLVDRHTETATAAEVSSALRGP